MLAGSSSAVRDDEVDPRGQRFAYFSRSMKPAYIAAVVLAALILIQYFLFREFALREVTWVHPTATDQSAYLLGSYEEFEAILQRGLFQGLWDAVTVPSRNGIMLPAQAAILYLFLGANRLSALTLLFFYFALSEVVLVWTIRSVTRSWPFAAATLSLFLLSASRFFQVGSLFDFRIDSVAASLYLITICLAISSGLFASRRLSVACGISAGVLVLFRFVAVTYTGALFALIAAVYAVGYFRGKPKDRVVNCCICIATMLLISGPILLRSASLTLAYYGGHFGTEKEFRQIEQGVNSLSSHLWYYPRTLYTFHLGGAYVAGLLLLIGIVAVSRYRTHRTGEPIDGGTPQLKPALLFAAAAVLIPLVLFTVDLAKSPVVAGVLVGPITLVVALAAFQALQSARWDARSLAIGCGLLSAFALWHEFSAVSKHSPLHPTHSEEEELFGAYRAMIDYAKDAGWKQMYVAKDRITDYNLPALISIMHYEWTGELLPAVLTIGAGFDAVPRENVIATFGSSDFAMLTVRFPRDAVTIYPFDKEMIPMRDELWNETRKRMSLLRTFTYGTHDIAIFARTAIHVRGVSGDWLTSDGASLVLPCKQLSGKRTLTASGRTIFPEMLNGPLHVTATLNPASDARTLPTQTSPITATYSIQIDLQNANAPNDGSCEIALAFDRYFVPKERGINPDPRKLVIETPTGFQIE